MLYFDYAEIASRKVFADNFVPYSPRVREIAEEIIGKINATFPDLPVAWIGASALGISGQGDIDLNILSSTGDYQKYLPTLKRMFGQPAKETPTLMKWEFNADERRCKLLLF